MKFSQCKSERGYEQYAFFCPGCHYVHIVSVVRPGVDVWSYNGDADRPTIDPSYLMTIPPHDPYPGIRCHSFVRNGQIQYLSDCSHKLAGQTVELPEWRGFDPDNYSTEVQP